MSAVFVELSGESLALARAEADAATSVLGGSPVGAWVGVEAILEVSLDPALARPLAHRLALAHRIFVRPPLSGEGHPLPRSPGESAMFRPFRRPSGGAGEAELHRSAGVWKSGGGRIDLESPDRRFWLVPREGQRPQWLEEVAAVDRPATAGRRLSALPFRRPVGLDPRLARAAANLARVPLGGRVVDPFVGTGALLAEAALLGARTVGIDRDPTMVQGALRNFAHLGVTADAMVVGDAGSVEGDRLDGPFDAVISDLPYGRASGTGGEDATGLARRVLPRWVGRVRPAGRVVLILPGGDDPIDAPWERVVNVPVRVHRSLTREFRVYARRS
jgi:tRNA (guanine10-N2)-dimethyltransferase